MRELVLCVGMLLALWCGPAPAHDMPERVLMQAHVKPEAGRLQVLLRLPTSILLGLNLPRRGPGYLDLAQIDDAPLQAAAAAAAQDIVLYENGNPLRPARAVARISRGSDRSFESYAQALALIEGPALPPQTEVFWNQGYLDLLLQYTISSAASDFAIESQLAPALAARTRLTVQYQPPDGPPRAYQLEGDAGRVMLDPRWHQAAQAFVRLGFLHILDGVDHLLFLVCLVVPFRRIGWTLVGVVTAFTVAHSVTLIAAAYGLVPSSAWFPPLVETLIALSILYMAVENALRPRLQRRWIVTFAFGLVHGFGFSFLLRSQMQFAGDHLLASLLAFNVGIELGQLLVLAVVLPLVALVLRWTGVGEKALTLLVSLLVGHTAWHWTVERAQALDEFDWPAGAPGWVSTGVLFALAAGVVAAVVFARQRARTLARGGRSTAAAAHGEQPG